MNTDARVWVAVPAAGSGARMGGALPKQYLPLAGRPLAEHTLSVLLALPDIEEIVVALAPGDPHWASIDPALRARVRTVAGGADRAASVRRAIAGFSRMPAAQDWVLVHDMARPCVTVAAIVQLLSTIAGEEAGGLLAQPVVDTLKRADADGRVACTVPREGLWRAQTPQVFRHALLVRALEEAEAAGVVVTDEAMAIERLGGKPRLVPGPARNIKVTSPEDLALAAHYLAQPGDSAPCA